MIVADDDVYAAFKNNRHSNFKANYVNTLGAFENGKLFSLCRKWHAVVALAYSIAVDGGAGPVDSGKISEML